ncbi:MAG TPA: LLM class flavin-dependent oxidoreductase [Dehalococcoidia bacterium]|nr:LLM class flavin-dependent oxidoreductase [Dehalococcoidia bacterium]
MSELSTRVQFGLFDWIDFTDPADLGGIYEGRLKMLDQADKAGFYCYHLAEHHLTTLGGTPSPGIFLAAATQRTSRIHLGPLVYILPLYLPVRLAQEISMLDHLSGGRIELGTGRGISPMELQIGNVTAEASRDVYSEAYELLIQALSTGSVGPHHGAHFDVDEMELILQPVQRPYPPLWYPVGSNEMAKWLGEQAINTVTLFENLPEVRETFDIYKEAWAANRDNPKRLNAHEPSPKLGLLRQVYLADSHDRAVREGRAAFDKHRDSFFYLWEKHGIAEQWHFLKDYDLSSSQGGILFGTPEEVRERLAGQLDATGANYLVANLSFGDLTSDQILQSIGLFSEQVMPKLT